ncbi:hypothetical protein LP316_09765 [Thalassotalea sp. LPB0316]|uniref:hypothetical protein n=1 Tax=Thalassotalea sp. LPB0316 TaxID=2769490 RepID=UPI001868A0EC|nr:hypothetical protein [Thalassotalea sp. LPB0316]QOL24631.1 hypothetical protein LP316_09765 [Thalassotalea sp. LPB0316]
MDIFTTQLRRVVPVRIKPEKLKVKALAKDSKVGKLSEEQDHSLKDEVDVYIHAEHQQAQEQSQEQSATTETIEPTKDDDDESHKGTKLDIFV